MSLRAKILLSITAVALVVAAATVVTQYFARKRQLLEEFQFFVSSVAGTARLSLSGEDLRNIRSNADADSPVFQRARAYLEQVRSVNHLDENEIYILRPIAPGSFETEFVVMLQARTFIGDRYPISLVNRPTFQEAWATGQPKATGIYQDAHGTWISGYATLMDSAHKPVALIEVDAELSKFLQKLRSELWSSCAIALDAFVIAMIPGLLLARSLTRGIQKLSEGIQRFQSGQHDVQVSLHSNDEIHRLADVFNEMVLSLREKLALLPFVSRFTAEAVRRSRHDPSWLTGAEHEVVVLFADLRGFTRFSEQREAKKLVDELNRLLGLEAEVVLSAGGDVDKFVGDAVMALFMDQVDGAARALSCGQELLRRVHEQTTKHGWPLALGIGIHCGRVIVGSIGSEVRRDFTAIGHTVNLASRLCDKAEGWQILVSETFLRSLPPDRQQDFVKTEPMQLKNVEQFIATYIYSCATCDVTGRPLSLPRAS
jgi:class 3 adenylate cyclase